MKDQYFKNEDMAFEHLNNQFDDELDLLEAIGPSYFKTHKLWRFKGQIDMKYIWMYRLHRLSVIFAVLSPLWLALSFFLDWLGYPKIATSAAAMFPISLLLFLICVGLISKYFKGQHQLEHVEKRIDRELTARQKNPIEEPHDLWKTGLN